MTTWKQVAYRTWQNGDFRLRQIQPDRWRASYNANFWATGKDRARALTNLADKLRPEPEAHDVKQEWWAMLRAKALALAEALQEAP